MCLITNRGVILAQNMAPRCVLYTKMVMFLSLKEYTHRTKNVMKHTFFFSAFFKKMQSAQKTYCGNSFSGLH